MSDKVTVDLFGVLHRDDPGKVTDELREFADGADAVFVSFPSGTSTVMAYLQLLARAPVYFCGAMLLQTLLLSPLYLLSTRDVVPSGYVAGERLRGAGVDVHLVGQPVNAKVRTAGPATIAWNWALLAPIVWWDPFAAAATIALALTSSVSTMLRLRGQKPPAVASAVALLAAAAGLFVAGLFSPLLAALGALAYLVVANRSADWIQETAAEEAAALTAEHGYEAVTLVKGRNFLASIAPELRERGFEIRRGHLSERGGEGETYESFDPEQVGETSTGDDEPRVIEPGSEESVAGRRALAAVIDVVPSLFAVVAWLVVFFVAADYAPGTTVEDAEYIATVVAAVVGPVTYHTATEEKWGQSIGKRALGLTVADAEDGTAPSAKAAFVRNLVRPVDVQFCYGFDAIVMFTSDRRQRFGDRLAGTVVGRRRDADDAETMTDDAAVEDARSERADGERATAQPASGGGATETGDSAGDEAPAAERPSDGDAGGDQSPADESEKRTGTSRDDGDRSSGEDGDLPEQWQRED